MPGRLKSKVELQLYLYLTLVPERGGWSSPYLSHFTSGRKSLQYAVSSSMGGREVVNSRDI